jgi:PAS domain-containing protein
VIAKSDYEEVMSPIDRRSEKIVLVFGATILMAAFLVWSLWRSQQQETHELTVRHLRFVHAVQDMFIVLDADNRILETNAAAQRRSGTQPRNYAGWMRATSAWPTARRRTPRAQPPWARPAAG